MIWTSNWLQRQAPEVRTGIARLIDTAGERMRQGGRIAFRFQALLAVASVPQAHPPRAESLRA